MKFKLLVLALGLLSFGTNAQVLFEENFDGCALPTDWSSSTVTGSDDWLFGDNTGDNVDGTCMAYFDDDAIGDLAAFSLVEIESPTIDLSGNSAAEMTFDYVFEDLGASAFHVLFWNGSSYDTVFTETTDPGCFGWSPFCGPRQAVINVSDHLNSDFKFKLVYDDGDDWSWYVGVDNIVIEAPAGTEAELTSIDTPNDGCGLTMVNVSLSITNLGSDTVTSIDASYDIDGMGAVAETFTVSIPFGGTEQVTFTTQFDASAIATYSIEAWIDLAGDTVQTNDSLTASFSNIPVISGLPYFEDFENGDGGWISGGINSSWELGLPTNTFIDTAASGVNAWVTNLDSLYNNGEISFVESPCMDFSGLVVDPILEFAQIFTTESCCDEGYVDLSLDAGATWTRLGAFGEGTNWYNDAFNNWWDGASGGAGEWRLARHLITGAAGEANVKLRIGFSSDGSVADEGFGVDDIHIFEQPAINAGVAEILSPASGCGMGATESVILVIQNFGSDTLTGFEVGYDIGNGPVTETYNANLLPGSLDTITLTSTVDLSAFGTFNMEAWTMVLMDGDSTNDSTSTVINSFELLSTLPYFQDFENGDGGWITGGTLSSWELGLPTNTFIDTAFSGVNAWVTNLDSAYNNSELSFIESPCMDFSGLNIDPVLRFAHIYSTEACCDEGFVDVSFDAGNTWARLGAFGEGDNWYNDQFNNWWDGTSGTPGEWRVASHLIDGAAGQSNVKVRFVFSSDGSVSGEGFGVDDVQIFEQPAVNAGIIEILSPMTGCGLGSESVTVVIENFGDTELVDYMVGFNVGAGDVMETVTDTLAIAEVDTFTFTGLADLSIPGTYDLSAWTAVVGDGDLLNDTLSTTITSSPVINTLPYTEDFESGEGGWYAEMVGLEGIWEFGDPEGVSIDTANSGINAWVSNRDSLNYPNGMLSYLYSPCFDLSGLVIDPILNFAIIFNSENGWDGTWVEVSTDAGATWSLVGNLGEGENWFNNNNFFNANIDQGWAGSSAETIEWINAEHLLDGTAGFSDVIIRFGFSSDGSVNTFEGAAIDDISLTEQPPINGELTEFLSPVSACGLGMEDVTAVVTNLGSEVMDSVMISYSINGNTPVMETFNDTLLSGAVDTFTFVTTADLSVPGDYEFEVIVTTIGDGDEENDTLTAFVQNIPTITGIPYFIDFESGSGGWASTGGTNGNWELGDPEGVLIDSAFSGVNAWATNLNTLNYENGQFSELVSPCIDFSGVTEDPIISFATIFNSEFSFDGFFVEASIDGGATWSLVGTMGEGINWYTNDDFFNIAIDEGFAGNSAEPVDWIEAETILEGVAGESDVRIRFVFASDGSVNGFEGAAIDDISIFPQPVNDLVAIRMEAPMDGCGLSDEAVTIRYWNKGTMTQTSYDLGYTVDGNTVTETATITIAQGDSASYTFTTLADLSTAGNHNITVFTDLAGDENMSNDTAATMTVTHHADSPLEQSEVTSVGIISGAGTAVSSMFFCDIPESLDGCFELAYVAIDSISHDWLSDLEISLVSPAGDTVLLSSGNGCCVGGDIQGVIFEDDAANDITLQTNGIAPDTSYIPQDSLGLAQLMDGQNPNGEWQLLVEDMIADIDVGTIKGWSLGFVDHSPTVSLSMGDSTICVNHTIELSATAGMDSYLWNTFDNGQTLIINGGDLGVGTHDYSVTVDLDGCSGESETITITVDECVGIEEANGVVINLYPNPTEGEVILEIDGSADAFILDVVETSGRVVYTEMLPEGTTRKAINLNQLASGVYTVRLMTNGNTTTKKLFVK